MHRIAWLVLAVGLPLAAADVNHDLLEAARAGNLDSVKALLVKGAELEAKTDYGQTPLYLAAMNGHAAVVEFLLSKGAKSEVSDSFYKAPMLDFAVARKHYDIAKMLIAKGQGKPDDQLGEMVQVGQADLVQAVLDKGKPSQAALDKAYEAALDEKRTVIAEMLKKAGAQEPVAALHLDPKVLASYTGTYKTDQFPLDIKVSVKEGKLYMQATGQPEFAPKPKSATAFAFAPAGLEIEFDSADSFTLKQGSMNLKFKKVVTP